MNRSKLLVYSMLALGGVICQAVAEQSPSATTCIDCHDNIPKTDESASLRKLLANSVHDTMDCTDCHESISMDELNAAAPKPHGDAVPPVACSECHEDEADAYVKHGRLEVGTDADIPTCSSCHGTHDIVPSSNERSRVHPNNLYATCSACHTDVNLIKDHDILRDEPIKLYEGSVHGCTPDNGPCDAASCIDCHSANGEDGQPTAHRILSATDPESTVYRFNVPATCGKCHRGAAEDYGAGIHGQLTKRGEMDAPVCTHCHGEHGILPVSNLRSPVSAARLAEATCAPCHESVALNERYGIPAGHCGRYHSSLF